MQPTDEHIQASLDAPGAGIPWHHRLIIHLAIRPLVERRASWRDCEVSFAGITEQLRHTVEGLTAAQLETRVLVPRLIGLEDSSRYWSVAMTCRHLEIVGSLIVDVVGRLSRGEVIAERVDFAAVKPVPVPASAVNEYQRFARSVPDRLASQVVNPQAVGTVPHPWFGALDARGWLWLLGFHSWVHLRQVRAIRARLPSAPH